MSICNYKGLQYDLTDKNFQPFNLFHVSLHLSLEFSLLPDSLSQVLIYYVDLWEWNLFMHFCRAYHHSCLHLDCEEVAVIIMHLPI